MLGRVVEAATGAQTTLVYGPAKATIVNLLQALSRTGFDYLIWHRL